MSSADKLIGGGSALVRRVRWNQVARWAARVALVVLILLLTGVVFRVGGIWWLYSRISRWVTVQLGLDYYVALLATTVLLSLCLSAVPSLAWFVFLGRRRSLVAGATIGAVALVVVLVYTIGSNVYFDRISGRPLRYFADTPKGRRFSFTQGFDPEFGMPFRQYTADVAQAGWRASAVPTPRAAPTDSTRMVPPATSGPAAARNSAGAPSLESDARPNPPRQAAPETLAAPPAEPVPPLPDPGALEARISDANWQPRPEWGQALSGQPIVIEFSDRTAVLAARLGKRLRVLGASPFYRRIEQRSQASSDQELLYNVADLRRAQAAASALSDIAWLTLTSTVSAVDMTLRIGRGAAP